MRIENFKQEPEKNNEGNFQVGDGDETSKKPSDWKIKVKAKAKAKKCKKSDTTGKEG